MADAVLRRLNVPVAAVALVGDRLTTDMAMADAAGMVGVLVLSGVATTAEFASQFDPAALCDRGPHPIAARARPPRHRDHEENGT